MYGLEQSLSIEEYVTDCGHELVVVEWSVAHEHCYGQSDCVSLEELVLGQERGAFLGCRSRAVAIVRDGEDAAGGS